jgi:hypothetical protein
MPQKVFGPLLSFSEEIRNLALFPHSHAENHIPCDDTRLLVRIQLNRILLTYRQTSVSASDAAAGITTAR